MVSYFAGNFMLSACVLLVYVAKTFSQEVICDEEEILAREEVTRIGYCAGGRTLIQILSEEGVPPRSSYKVCHDERNDETLWSRHEIDGNLLPGSGEAGGFRIKCFYENVKIKESYTQRVQRETLQQLTGTDVYFDISKLYFFSIGHLAPNADFQTQNQRAATYFFINASPEWQKTNQGNRLTLETSLRNLAMAVLRRFIIWTGTYETLTLRHENTGQQIPISLGRAKEGGGTTNNVPVNYFIWKIIYEPISNSGVVIIQVNNPRETRENMRNIPCADVCASTNWFVWESMREFAKGYTHCCTVDAFRQWVPHVRDFPTDFEGLPTGPIPLLRVTTSALNGNAEKIEPI